MDRRNPADVTARTPIALTIAGSDSGGGAGIQADLRTFAALGVYGASAITALTAQNTLGVRAIHLAPPDVVAAQIEAVLDDFSVAAIKIGMLGSVEIVEAVAEALGGLPSPLAGGAEVPSATNDGFARDGRDLRRGPLAADPSHAIAGPQERTFDDGRWREGGKVFVVYDPVMTASSGDSLSGPGFVEAIRTWLLPLVDCLTPNLDEAAALLGEGFADSEAAMARQGRALIALGAQTALMKGGHLEGEAAVDLLVSAEAVHRFAAERIVSGNLHGSGCTLSSAVAAYLVRGRPLPEAVGAAKTFAREAIERGRYAALGHGPGPLIQVNLLPER
jgi:hydroxymethylpyrimidine/phosphomethylpyrimidine kinase